MLSNENGRVILPTLMTELDKSKNKCAGLKYMPEGRSFTRTQGSAIRYISKKSEGGDV